ncbi:predicted protein [Chaetoceros tenuissimus]|uniref:MYND-type domain-containing protein n=1 Tax=Chaetoceros tenuissimus TaxID=426638 RepID=A0AAD3HFN0_9STRA|nr:predicted protein [Chaetoceros tenuissimus]
MGKRSKRKNKNSKLLQPDNDLHLKRINIYESTAKFLDGEHTKLELVGRLRDCYGVALKLLQSMKNIRQDYVAVNRDQFHDEHFVSLLDSPIRTQMRAQEYSNALDLCKEAINVKGNPMRSFYISCIDLFLLRIEGFSSARVTRVSQQVYELIKINKGLEFLGSGSPIYSVFVDCALGELNRLRQFDMVRDLSSAMIEHQNKIIVRQGEVFARFSCVDLIRSIIINEDLRQLDLTKVRKIMYGDELLDDYDETGMGYLAKSLILFYLTYIGDGCISDKDNNDMLNSAFLYMREYLAIKTKRSSWKCCLCEETRSSVNEHVICQGCRVVSYCCKDCQRSNYLYSEQTRTRGLGHKHLCPVFKAFRKRKNNEDASKNDLLERKFQRACYRFFLSTLDTFKE